MPANMAQFGLAIKIYSVLIYILNNNSAIWVVNMKPQNKQMQCQILPRRLVWLYSENHCRYHRLFIYDVERTTKINGMCPFNKISNT